MKVGGAEVRVLAPPARAFHIGLHAASDGNREKPRRDLQRALDQLEEPLWREALAVAERLDAIEAFAAGLRRLPEGAALADRLGLPETRSVATALKASDAPHEALTVAHLAETRGAGAKAKIVANRLFPSPSYMRFRSALARRGRVGLAAAYAVRPFSVAARAPRAVKAWKDASRR
jgi:hypothetical protein